MNETDKRINAIVKAYRYISGDATIEAHDIPPHVFSYFTAINRVDIVTPLILEKLKTSDLSLAQIAIRYQVSVSKVFRIKEKFLIARKK